MQILGRTLAGQYEEFYSSIKGELTVDVEYEEASSEGFDAHGSFFGRSRVDLPGRSAHIWLNVGLPDAAFSHTAGHELAHVLQSLRGFYKTSVLAGLGPESEESQVSANLSEATECVAVDQLIGLFGLDPSFSINARYEALFEILRKAARSYPERGTPLFARVSLRYIRARLEQPENAWLRLSRGFRTKFPQVAEAAEGLVRKVLETGLTTVEARRDSMLVLRDELKLRGKVFIENPLTGHKL